MPETGVAALPHVVSTSHSASLRPFGRPAKLVLFAGLGFAGGYGLLSEGSYIATSDAVVSAYVVEVRAPIDGTLSRVPLAAGVLVRQGDLLAQIQNPLSDRQHFDNLSAEAASEAASAAAIEQEQAALAAQRHSLLSQAAQYNHDVSARFRHQVAEAERLAASADATLAQAELDLRRGEQLHAAGIVADADYDRLRSGHEIALAQSAAAHAAVAALREEAASAAHGIMTDPGQNMDVTYSRQRADEIAMKMTDNARTLESSAAQAAFARSSAAQEAARAAALRRADLVSPISGILWDLNATDGERTAAGDTLLTLVDCSRDFVLARIPQDRVPDVALRGPAHYRLSGESIDRTGTVLSVTGADKKLSAQKLAAAPQSMPDTHAQLATVWIAPDPGSAAAANGSACQVGRTARVLVPTVPSTVASRWMRAHL